MNLEKFCQYTYQFSFIPIYIYDRHQLLSKASSYPSLQLPEMILTQILEKKEPVSVFETVSGTYYGSIRVGDGELSLLLGPVSPVPYTEDTLASFFYSYRIPPAEQETYKKQLSSIPCYTLLAFISLLLQITYAVRGEESYSEKDFLNPSPLYGIPRETELIREKKQRQETGYYNTIHDARRMTDPLIRNGDLEGLERYSKNALPMTFGNYSPDPRRQKLVLFVITIAYTMDSAISGGLDQQEALLLAESYIRNGLTLHSPSDIDTLSMQAVMDFTSRVRTQKDQSGAIAHPTIQDCIRYIREGVYRPLTVAEVAGYSGYHVDYFSRLFKKEMGFCASAFIMNCRLYEAKKLLKFTNETIGEISSHLHFANQSHFQRMFKKKFHMTPLQFRNTSGTNSSNAKLRKETVPHEQGCCKTERR